MNDPSADLPQFWQIYRRFSQHLLLPLKVLILCHRVILCQPSILEHPLPNFSKKSLLFSPNIDALSAKYHTYLEFFVIKLSFY